VSATLFSIRNPLVVSGIAVALCLFGVFANSSLGVAITPNVNVPHAVVTTTYPGADPATVEANVTRPIEDAIATLPNIDTNGLTSTSAFGVSIVRVQFTSAANADLVAVDRVPWPRQRASCAYRPGADAKESVCAQRQRRTAASPSRMARLECGSVSPRHR
jgi:hypothetical protein